MVGKKKKRRVEYPFVKTVYLKNEDIALINAIVKDKGVTVSEFIRDCIYAVIGGHGGE